MKINTGKKAIICGLIYGILTFAIYVAFTCVVFYLTDGERFIHKDETRQALNGISFTAVKLIGGIIAFLIPILLIRYNVSDYYFFAVCIGILLYIFLFVATFFIIMPFIPAPIVGKIPLNSFDALLYGVIIFPFGSALGMMVTPAINDLLNKKHSKSE